MDATADLLKQGQKATITGLKDGVYSQKLAEMGCVPGTEIVRLYESSGGKTIAFRIDTYWGCARRKRAKLKCSTWNWIPHEFTEQFRPCRKSELRKIYPIQSFNGSESKNQQPTRHHS